MCYVIPLVLLRDNAKNLKSTSFCYVNAPITSELYADLIFCQLLNNQRSELLQYTILKTNLSSAYYSSIQLPGKLAYW